MQQSGIYEIHNSVNGKRYVGSAKCLRIRFNEHRCGLRNGKHHNRYLRSAVNKYGLDAFRFETLLICKPGDLLFYEQRAIDVLVPEYNLARVAGNTLGTKRTAETRAKIAEKARGIKRGPRSAEHCANLSAALKGKPKSPEYVEKIQGRGKGVALSAAHRTALGEASKAAWARRKAQGLAPKSAEWRAKIAATLRGRKATAEHRANQAAAQRGKKRGPYKRNSEVLAA